MKIKLEKRYKYTGDIYKALVEKAEYPIEVAADLLNGIKDADVVEVVRCKDCRFCKKHPTSDKTKMCTNEQQWVTECYPLVFDNDYCSYGERKEE